MVRICAVAIGVHSFTVRLFGAISYRFIAYASCSPHKSPLCPIAFGRSHEHFRDRGTRFPVKQPFMAERIIAGLSGCSNRLPSESMEYASCTVWKTSSFLKNAALFPISSASRVTCRLNFQITIIGQEIEWS
jgi:hypothetical protein